MLERYFKGDKWTRLLGSRIPIGSLVKVIKFYPRRRVMVEYEGEAILTMLWCLSKTPIPQFQERGLRGREASPLLMSHQESGRLGGLATLNKYGKEFYSVIGARGGRPRQKMLSELRQLSVPETQFNEGGNCSNSPTLPRKLSELKELWNLRNKERGSQVALVQAELASPGRSDMESTKILEQSQDTSQLYPETLYYARRVSDGGHQPVYKRLLPDGEPTELSPEPSQKLYNHSPDGFQWGYSGSGPAQLALALLLDATSDPELALAHYQQFKFDYVSGWGEEWSITTSEILTWLKEEQKPALLERLSTN